MNASVERFVIAGFIGIWLILTFAFTVERLKRIEIKIDKIAEEVIGGGLQE